MVLLAVVELARQMAMPLVALAGVAVLLVALLVALVAPTMSAIL